MMDVLPRMQNPPGTLLRMGLRPRPVLLACLLASLPGQGEAALNVGTHDVEDLATALRRSIFVEKQYVRQPSWTECSSLDGPRCLGLGNSRPRQTVIDGLIPERILKDLGAQFNLTDFLTPGYDALEFVRWKVGAELDDGDFERVQDVSEGAALSLHEARSGTEAGFLHFNEADLIPDTRLFSQFSRGLPAKTVASWEGRWLVRDCTASFGATLGMPRWPAISASDEPQVLLPSTLDNPITQPSGTISLVAQLQSAIGYIRFSRPVVVRSLLARWSPHPGSHQPPAIVAGRLGLDSSWTTHLDPMRATDQWIDVGGDSLATVDELVFIAAVGLEIGALEVSAYDGAGSFETRTVLMLSPTPRNENLTQPFFLHPQTLSPASVSFVTSVHEIAEKDLQLALADTGSDNGLAPTVAIPGVLRSAGRFFSQGLKSTEIATLQGASLPWHQDDAVWRYTAAAHRTLFDQQYLVSMLIHGQTPRSAFSQMTDSLRPQALQGVLGSSPMERMLSDAFQGKVHLPKDLLRLLHERAEEILATAVAWVRGGGKWRSNAPSFLPRDSSEEMIRRYAAAKSGQLLLDALTAGFLYWGSAQKGPVFGAANEVQ